MSEWISVKDRLPTTSEDCLLFIKQYRSDSGSFWSDHIVTGFWSNEYEDDEVGFYAQNFTIEFIGHKDNELDGVNDYEFLSDSKHIEITHWMPLPEPPEVQG